MKNLISAYFKLYEEEEVQEKKELLIEELSSRIENNKEFKEVELPELWKNLRSSNKLKQKDIAERMGVSQQTASNMLNKEEVTFLTFKNIVEAFDEEIIIETKQGLKYKIK